MDQTVKAFLTNHRVSVFSLLRDEHSIDSATLHYAYREEPLAFYFLTDKDSRKVRPLLSGKEVSAALVVGFDESEFATFQAEGSVVLLASDSAAEGWKVYTQKHPEREKLKTDPDIVLLKFTPTWWRYTDMKTKPKSVISSDE